MAVYSVLSKTMHAYHHHIDESLTFANWRKTCFQCHSSGGRSSFGLPHLQGVYSARLNIISKRHSLRAASSAHNFICVVPAQVSSRRVALIGSPDGFNF